MAPDAVRASRFRLALLPAGVLLLAGAIRLAWLPAYQTLWPDEAAYLLIAKRFAGLADAEIPASRPVALPLLWSLLFRAELAEPTLRALGILFSLLSVHLLWRLGRRLYGEAEALVASLLLAVFWLDVFLAERLLTDGPALALWLLALLLVWRSRVAPASRAVLLLGPVVALLLLVRLGAVVLLPVLLVLLAVARGRAALRDARLWRSAGLGALVALPYLGWCWLHHGQALAPLFALDSAVSPAYAANAARAEARGVMVYLRWFPTLYLDPVLCALLALGALAAALGLRTARRGARARADAFVLAWLGATPLAVGALIGHAEPRFLLPAFPAAFLLVARGVRAAASLSSRRLALAAGAAAALALAWAGHQQLAASARWLRQYSLAYSANIEAASWLARNASAEAAIYAAERELIEYYSDRRASWYPATSEELERALERHRLAYFVVVRSNASQPAWLREFLARHAPDLRFAYPSPERPLARVYALAAPAR